MEKKTLPRLFAIYIGGAQMSVKIFSVAKNGICGKKGIRPGDLLLSINSHEINDVLDYRFYALGEKLKIDFLCADGRKSTVKLSSSDACERLGISFETFLMDKHRRCKNSCVFCFIDQLPKGLRKSLYFKDDDSRLSFLFGNYITLTNLTEADVERIIKMRISPVNVSVHTMNPDLRVKMMRNPSAGKVLSYLKRFSDSDIDINAQLVLCPGINDGSELLFSLTELSKLSSVRSVAAVPVGMTKFRDELYPLDFYNKESAGAVIDLINSFNESLEKQGRDKIAYPSDEFFLLSEREMPDVGYYGDFSQLDNGVGMYALTADEFRASLSEADSDNNNRVFSVATGVSAYPLIKKLADEFMTKFPSSVISVYCIKNRFFGEKVTVAGLITGTDLISRLKEYGFLRGKLLLPSVMFKSSTERIFLDDVAVEDAEAQLNAEIIICECSGKALFDSFYNN